MSGTLAKTDRLTFAPSRAARELGLRRPEFDLAVNLGLIRTAPYGGGAGSGGGGGDGGGGSGRGGGGGGGGSGAGGGEAGGRVARAELDRLRAAGDFPEGLRERVRTVGTHEGAALLEIAPTRFTSLARFGLLVPVRFYLNRYRTVVWLYLAEELRQFADEASNARLLSGRLPAEIREGVKRGLDRRPRNWRGRHSGFLLRQAGDDPWARAAAVAGLLDPADVAEVVPDARERARLDRFRPRLPAHGAPGSPAAELAERLMTATEPDEVAWFKADLLHTLDTARSTCPAPRPGPVGKATPAPHPTPPKPTGLLGRIRHRARRSPGRSLRARPPSGSPRPVPPATG
ncbi:hypothetical protein SUDANB108_00954 [Streptomyces sp. enrichment culture]|uniref:DUF6397 family protein n=1 Tax=Streptomyces sp. enrichment culture TaxID=1795815 RepID=UPI003F5653D4